MVYHIRLQPEAETDLQLLYQGLLERSGSQPTARGYINRITDYLQTFEMYPKRGSLRNEIKHGLRVVGFERRVSIAFLVDDDANEVVVFRILYGGQDYARLLGEEDSG